MSFEARAVYSIQIDGSFLLFRGDHSSVNHWTFDVLVKGFLNGLLILFLKVV